MEKYHNLFSEEFSEPHIHGSRSVRNFMRKIGIGSEYKILGFARNPWDREVSHFEYKKRYVEKCDNGEIKKNQYVVDCKLLLEKCDWNFKNLYKIIL